jgi:uncharacterized protein DUF4230
VADNKPRRPRWPLFLALLLFALAVVVGRGVSRTPGRLQRLTSGETTVTQAVVVEQTRAVARLVTSETVLRDVVTYENRRLGSTKRSLVVATAKVLTGFDLDRGLEVTVDHPSRRIRITLPPPSVQAVEITDLRAGAAAAGGHGRRGRAGTPRRGERPAAARGYRARRRIHHRSPIRRRA